MPMVKLEDLTLDQLVAGFRRLRWIAVENAREGEEAAALVSLRNAAAYADRIKEVGGTIPM